MAELSAEYKQKQTKFTVREEFDWAELSLYLIDQVPRSKPETYFTRFALKMKMEEFLTSYESVPYMQTGLYVTQADRCLHCLLLLPWLQSKYCVCVNVWTVLQINLFTVSTVLVKISVDQYWQFQGSIHYYDKRANLSKHHENMPIKFEQEYEK